PAHRGTLVSWPGPPPPRPGRRRPDPPGTPASLAKRTFRINFPTQDVSGTYTVQVGPNMLASATGASAGAAMDPNQNAGVDALRQTPSGGTLPIRYTNPNTSTIPNKGTVDSSINVPDNFLIQGITVQVNITYANDPDLVGTLIFTPNGGGAPIRITLFSHVGASAPPGKRNNFSGTIFDDTALTNIVNGGPPFLGSFSPVNSLRAPL